MKKTIYLLPIVVLSLLAFSGALMSNVERPKYEVIVTNDDIEHRLYEKMIVAEVEIFDENRKEALKQGFKKLAEYIFRGNSDNLSIDMTAPVMQVKIDDGWKISFVMPKKFRLENLPKPNNNEIMIRETLVENYVVVKFSGFNTDSNIKNHESILNTYIEDNNIKTYQDKYYAFYNPPWTLPFMRENEILSKIDF